MAMRGIYQSLAATIATVALLTACGASDANNADTPADTKAAVAAAVDTTAVETIPAPETTEAATTTTAKPTGNEVASDCTEHQEFKDTDVDGYGSCIAKMIDIDAAAVLAAAQAAGLPPEVQCPIAARGASGNTLSIACTVTNFDGSEGIWKFTIDSAMVIAVPPTYTETKAAPLTRDTCTETPPDGQFQKDSSASTGRCLHFWASVFQFDANTGACSFLGHYGSSPYNRNYEFSDAIIRIDGGDRCDLLGPVVEDDLVEVWAVNTGIESYSTTIGGTNTYTTFNLVDIIVYD